MSRFAPALRRVSRELDLPRGVRASILLEIAADLDAVYEHHRKRGVEPEEAARRAEETVLGSSEVLRRLVRLHRRPWREWSEQVGERLTGGAELLLLALAVAPMLAMAGAVAVPRLLNGPASPFAWALLATGMAILALTISKIPHIRGATGPDLRRGLPYLLLLSAVAPALGLLVLALGLHSSALALSAGGVEAAAQVAAAERIGRDGALLAASLLLGIAGSLSWFVLMNRASVLDAREVDILLEPGLPRELTARKRTILPLARRSR